MDELFDSALKQIEKRITLEPIALPAELKDIKLPLGLVDMHCYNWKAEKIRKIYFVRIKVKAPSFDIFGMALYPEPGLDIPSFACDFSCTRKKVFTYINFIPLFNEQSYLDKYIKPMKQLFDKHTNFPRHKIREWMQPYVSTYTVYTFPEKSFLNELKNCAIDYLTSYLDMFSQADEIKDASYRKKVEEAQKRYVQDLATNDASRKMLGRIIGKERANRFFQEVVV
jgi:15,16-dihydrobiliverdin:ferredoxin oxidoreductase